MALAVAAPTGTHPCDGCGSPLPDAPRRFPRYPELKWCDDCRPKTLRRQYRASYAKHRERRVADSQAWQARHPGAVAEARRERQRREPEAFARQRRRHLLSSKYGLTEAAFNELVARQGGVCGICQRPETRKGKWGEVQPLSVDHDHETGVVRGLLCARCNSVLGFIEQETLLEAAIRYLDQSREAVAS